MKIPKLCMVFVLGLPLLHGSAQTSNNVTTVGTSAYVINGANNPTLTLSRGVAYLFKLNATGHPFWIKTVPGIGTGNAYTSGVTGNGVQVGTLTFAVPADAPNTLYYNCQFHSAMTGALNIVDPVTAPSVRIVSIEVDTAVTITSKGAAGWSAVPEYCCGMPPTNWTAVAPFTNFFANGTNTTVFDRLDPVCGPNVFFRIREQLN